MKTEAEIRELIVSLQKRLNFLDGLIRSSPYDELNPGRFQAIQYLERMKVALEWVIDEHPSVLERLPAREEKRGMVYWIGLIICVSASLGLFGLFWMVFITWRHYRPYPQEIIRTPFIPAVVAGIVFIVIGLYMMKSEREAITTHQLW